MADTQGRKPLDIKKIRKMGKLSRKIHLNSIDNQIKKEARSKPDTEVYNNAQSRITKRNRSK